MAVIPLRMIGLTTGGGTLIYVFAYNLVTVGDGGRVMAISFGTQWLIFLPGAWFLGTVLHYGLLQIWIAQLCYGAVASHLITTRWRQGLWKQVKI
jgi:Na+-driven multidrug efflux pump